MEGINYSNVHSLLYYVVLMMLHDMSVMILDSVFVIKARVMGQAINTDQARLHATEQKDLHDRNCLLYTGCLGSCKTLRGKSI